MTILLIVLALSIVLYGQEFKTRTALKSQQDEENVAIFGWLKNHLLSKIAQQRRRRDTKVAKCKVSCRRRGVYVPESFEDNRPPTCTLPKDAPPGYVYGSLDFYGCTTDKCTPMYYWIEGVTCDKKAGYHLNGKVDIRERGCSRGDLQVTLKGCERPSYQQVGGLLGRGHCSGPDGASVKSIYKTGIEHDACQNMCNVRKSCVGYAYSGYNGYKNIGHAYCEVYDFYTKNIGFPKGWHKSSSVYEKGAGTTISGSTTERNGKDVGNMSPFTCYKKTEGTRMLNWDEK